MSRVLEARVERGAHDYVLAVVFGEPPSPPDVALFVGSLVRVDGSVTLDEIIWSTHDPETYGDTP